MRRFAGLYLLIFGALTVALAARHRARIRDGTALTMPFGLSHLLLAVPFFGVFTRVEV